MRRGEADQSRISHNHNPQPQNFNGPIYITFSCYSNDSFEGEPEEKRRKTTNVVIEQPATDSKVLIDSVPDNSSLFEEVCDTSLYTLSCTHSVFCYVWRLYFADSGVASGKLLRWAV